jgi:serine protease Do
MDFYRFGSHYPSRRTACEEKMRHMIRHLTLAGALAAGLAALPSAAAQQRAVPPAAAPLQSLSEAFASVAEHVKPSVVYIKSGRTPRLADTVGRPPMPPGFEYFFPDLPPQSRRFQQSSGSGFIVSADGYVLTNDHVVEGSDQVTVRLLDRREFKAKVVGTDPTTDLAVLKIDATGLTPARLGNSDAARVGEWVLAVGNPLGDNLTFTVTSGIISAKGRTLTLPNASQQSIQDFIQTDAAINPGNSGGPLVSVKGEVIGVNSAIASGTGFYAGYGFAIPINLARQVMDQIITRGRVQRTALGVQVRNASANDAAYVGLPEIRGVLVEDFAPTSAAKDAGIEPGDIIISIDGRPVEYVAQLQQRTAFRKPGETVKIEVARKGGVRRSVSVKLQELPGPRDLSSAPERATDKGDDGAVGKLGINVVVPDTQAVRQLGLDDEQQGPIIVDVTPGGPAWEELVDAERGGPDIILSVEGKRVRTPAELRGALAAFKAGDIVSLRIYNARAKTRRIERVRLGG